MSLTEILGLSVGQLVLMCVAVGARFTLAKKSTDQPTLKMLYGSLFSALLIVLAINHLLDELVAEGTLTEGWRKVILGCVSYMAKDILLTIDILWTQIKQDPLAILRELLNRWKPTSKPPEDS